MIALYPLLISNTISKNIVPGVCKSLENYIMVYGLDGLLQRIRKSSGLSGDWTIRNNKIIRKESVEGELANFLFEEIMKEGSGHGTQGGNKFDPYEEEMIAKAKEKGKLSARDPDDEARFAKAKEKGKLSARDPDEEERFAKAKERGKQSAIAKDANVKIDTFNSQMITLEPTWMKMDQVDTKTGRKMSGIVGVKVVPYAVKSDANLAQLLMYDNQVKGLQRKALLTGRYVINFLYRAWSAIWSKVPLIGDDPSSTVTGDPRKDIILKRTILATKDVQDIFVLANQADLNQDFYRSAKGMKNLQKMGWGSIIIADDVNKKVSFCMRELQGICSILPYSMMYQTFSQAKVYEDIEDAKRSSASIFKRNMKPMTKIIGESMAMNMIEEYSEDTTIVFNNENIELLDENLSDFIKSFSIGKAKSMITNLASANIPSGIPKTDTNTILKYAQQLDPNFKQGFTLANRVIKNSIPNISEKTASVGAMAVCVQSSLTKKDNFILSVKATLKKIIRIYRRLKGEPENVTLPKGHGFDALFGWVVLITTFYYMCKLFLPTVDALKQVYNITLKLWDYIKDFIEKAKDLKPKDGVEAIKDKIEELRDTASKDWKESDAGEIILALIIVVMLINLIRRAQRTSGR